MGMANVKAFMQKHKIILSFYSLAIISLLCYFSFAYFETKDAQQIGFKLIDSALSIFVFINLSCDLVLAIIYLAYHQKRVLNAIAALRLYNYVLVFSILLHPEYVSYGNLSISWVLWLAVICNCLQVFLINLRPMNLDVNLKKSIASNHSQIYWKQQEIAQAIENKTREVLN